MEGPDARAIVTSLGGRWQTRQGMCRCPAHDDRSPSMHVTLAQGTVLVKCFAGCDQRAVIGALRDLGLWPERDERGHPSAPYTRRIRHDEAPDEQELKRIERARAVWESSVKPIGMQAETYLRARGIRLPLPPTLRFHPALPYPMSDMRFPALIGAIQNSAGRITAVQRIYLRADGMGKAAVTPAKLGLGPMYDGAVRLGRMNGTIGIAEGIETALSAQQIFSVPTWAVLGCGRLHAVPLPPEVHTVVLFADQGEAGQAAARKAAAVYEEDGRSVVIESPPEDDWNAYLLKQRGAA